MRATVEDVHHRDGQDVRVRAAHVAEQRQAGRLGGGVRDGQRDAQHGVGAELALVVGPVELDHGGVDLALVGGVEADDLLGDRLVDVLDSLQDALAQVARLVAVAQLDGLELAGGSAGRDRSAALCVIVEKDLDLNGGVAARVEDLASVNDVDECHGDLPFVGV